MGHARQLGVLRERARVEGTVAHDQSFAGRLEGARELDAGRGGKEALLALAAGITRRVVDDVRLRVRQNGRLDPGRVQVMEGILAGGI